MFPRGGGGFGWGDPFGGAAGPGGVQPALPCAPAPTAPVPAQPPPAPSMISATSVRIVDALYSDVPTAEVTFLQREGRVPFSPNGAASDGTGNVLVYTVPQNQTLLISGVEFYAQRPNPLVAGDQLAVDPRQLAGYVALHLIVDDRAPMDLYAEIDAPKGAIDTSPLKGSIFSTLGNVVGGADGLPRQYLRARDGQTVRLAYTAVRQPVIVVDHLGALLKGYLIPSAIFDAKTSS